MFTALWLPMYGFLVGTSWLWLNAWPLRPVLLLPGVAVAVIGETYVSLAPEPERDAKHAKLSIAQEWPLSWYLLRPPPAYGLVPCDVCGGEGTYKRTGEQCFACGGAGRVTPELSSRLKEELEAEVQKRGVDRLTGEEYFRRLIEIVDEMQSRRRPRPFDGE